MKFFKSLFIATIFTSTSLALVAQPSKEAEIKGMEQKEKEAILHLDTATMEKLWDKDLIVNSPTNNVVDKAGGMFALKNGFIHFFLSKRNRKNHVLRRYCDGAGNCNTNWTGS